jgi:hypothetical protein
MSIEVQAERRLSAERAQVRVVDTDVHPYPRRGELEQFIPAAFRDLFLSRGEGAGSQNYYDPPDYAHAFAMRTSAAASTTSCRCPRSVS